MLFACKHPVRHLKSAFVTPFLSNITGEDSASLSRNELFTNSSNSSLEGGFNLLILSEALTKQSRMTPDMAIRLSRVLGRFPQSWLQMQMNYDLWQAEQASTHEELKKLKLV